VPPARTIFDLVALGAACIAAVGCGADKPLVPVTGRITYAGGDWPMPGYITFTPFQSTGALPARPGSGRFLEDGKFVAGSYGPGDGLMPGKYHVSISCFDPMDTSKPAAELNLVPADFKTEDLVVEQGQDSIVLNIDVPKKR
jgi:hypothetical protein